MINSIPPAHLNALQTSLLTHQEVLKCNRAKRKRQSDLYKAVSLGSIFARTVTIWIEGETDCTFVHMRAVAIGNKNVYLDPDVRGESSCALTIPINRICHVDFGG